jgi:hypothetical protein
MTGTLTAMMPINYERLAKYVLTNKRGSRLTVSRMDQMVPTFMELTSRRQRIQRSSVATIMKMPLQSQRPQSSFLHLVSFDCANALSRRSVPCPPHLDLPQKRQRYRSNKHVGARQISYQATQNDFGPYLTLVTTNA